MKNLLNALCLVGSAIGIVVCSGACGPLPDTAAAKNRGIVATNSGNLELKTGISPANLVHDFSIAINQAYRQVNPATVTIVSGNGNSSGLGSGFIWDTNGHIITNAHVVESSDSIEVIFEDGSTTAAELVGKDTVCDVAVLKVNSIPADAKIITRASVSSVMVGQWVLAFGSPYSLVGSASVGIVSQLRNKKNKEGKILIGSLIQIDAAVNPGNSGGPLVNIPEGQLLGINTFGYGPNNSDGADTGVNFAVGISVLESIVPSIINNG